MKTDYAHALLLVSRCKRGCDRPIMCISDRDGAGICITCAVDEEVGSTMN